MSIDKINPMAIKKASQGKAKSSGDAFPLMMDAVSASEGFATTAVGMYGDSKPAAVLAAAFSGVNQMQAQSAPSFAGGYGNVGYGGKTMDAGIYPQSGNDQNVIPGTEGFTQQDMINSMNQNNLYLLELQATMQSNMQAWNTKSNIMNADHRAKMAMIEKFTAR